MTVGSNVLMMATNWITQQTYIDFLYPTRWSRGSKANTPASLPGQTTFRREAKRQYTPSYQDTLFPGLTTYALGKPRAIVDYILEFMADFCHVPNFPSCPNWFRNDGSASSEPKDPVSRPNRMSPHAKKNAQKRR